MIAPISLTTEQLALLTPVKYSDERYHSPVSPAVEPLIADAPPLTEEQLMRLLTPVNDRDNLCVLPFDSETKPSKAKTWQHRLWPQSQPAPLKMLQDGNVLGEHEETLLKELEDVPHVPLAMRTKDLPKPHCKDKKGHPILRPVLGMDPTPEYKKALGEHLDSAAKLYGRQLLTADAPDHSRLEMDEDVAGWMKDIEVLRRGVRTTVLEGGLHAAARRWCRATEEDCNEAETAVFFGTEARLKVTQAALRSVLNLHHMEEEENMTPKKGRKSPRSASPKKKATTPASVNADVVAPTTPEAVEMPTQSLSRSGRLRQPSSRAKEAERDASISPSRAHAQAENGGRRSPKKRSCDGDAVDVPAPKRSRRTATAVLVAQ